MDPLTCLAALDGAIAAATKMGLSTDQAKDARGRIESRSGFPGDLYVLALIGGTGVGKSSLLNALAGETVSQAGALRPTTDLPVAWIPSSRAVQAGPLIDWLGGAESRVHSGEQMADVVILDLPDLDSVAADHRARVDAVLPRIDAVVWVSDPEKYQDAVLHDAYLRRWMPLLPRQVIVVNKADRVSAPDAQRLRLDLSHRLAAEGGREVSVLVTAAAPTSGGSVAGSGAGAQVSELRSWIDDGAGAKRIVTARLAAEARDAVFSLATEMGVPLDGSEPDAVIPATSRVRATRETIDRTLRVVDLSGLARQAEEATRAAARPRGGGPLGLLRTIAERGTGLHERRADPAGYLRRWRDRGSLVTAGEPLRDLMTVAVAALPAQSRPLAASLADNTSITKALAGAVDRAVGGEPAEFQPPTSRLWVLFGVAQLLATGTLIVGVIWMIALFAGVGRAETPLVSVPVLGPVPTPVLLVAGGLVAWFVLGRLLGLHAGWLGRRWARRLRSRVSSEVEERVGGTVMSPFAALDEARRAMSVAVRDVRACWD